MCERQQMLSNAKVKAVATKTTCDSEVFHSQIYKSEFNITCCLGLIFPYLRLLNGKTRPSFIHLHSFLCATIQVKGKKKVAKTCVIVM